MKRYTRKTLPQHLLDTTEWPLAEIASVDDKEEVVRLKALQEGIVRYLRFENMGRFLKEHNLTMETLLRALNRCVMTAADGTIFGWVGLRLHVRVKTYERTAPIRHADTFVRGGFAGALAALFEEHPQLEADLQYFCLTGRRRKGVMPESRVTDALAHQRFIALCHEYNVGDHEWPFICKTKGKSAISRYLKEIYDEFYEDIVEREYGERVKAKSNTGRGTYDDLFEIEAYDIWQIDEHSENVMAAVEVDSPSGPAWFPAGRPQVIAVGDPALSCVVGYSLTFCRQPESEDILDALSAALGEKPAHDFALEGMHHVTGCGFPVHLNPELRGLGPAVLEVDNALTHLAAKVIRRIRDRLGCSILFGPVKRFECRAFIESLFGWIEKQLMRCPSTTGTGPKDPRRRDPETNAVKFKMSPEALHDLNEAVFGKFNNRDESDLGRSVLDEIERLLGDAKRGFLPIQLLPTSAEEPKLGVSIETWKISGNPEKGDRPHIYFEYGRYEAEWLSECMDLVGKSVVLHIDRDRFRTMRVFLPNGHYLGEVTVQGWWSRAEHTRSQRTDVMRFIRERLGEQTEENNPMTLFFECHTKAVLNGSRGKKKKVTASARAIAESNLRGYHDPALRPSSSSTPPAAEPANGVRTSSSSLEDEEDEELPLGIGAIN